MVCKQARDWEYLVSPAWFVIGRAGLHGWGQECELPGPAKYDAIAMGRSALLVYLPEPKLPKARPGSLLAFGPRAIRVPPLSRARVPEQSDGKPGGQRAQKTIPTSGIASQAIAPNIRMKPPKQLSAQNHVKPYRQPAEASLRRQVLASVYALLIRLADEKDNALSGNFGEETEKALQQTPEQAEACDD